MSWLLGFNELRKKEKEKEKKEWSKGEGRTHYIHIQLAINSTKWRLLKKDRCTHMSIQLRAMCVDIESTLLHPGSLAKKMKITGHLEHQGFHRPLENQEGAAEWTQWPFNFPQYTCWPWKSLLFLTPGGSNTPGWHEHFVPGKRM